MQNLVVLMESSEDAWNASMKTGFMILNRFCIDEDAAFELSGVSHLKESSRDIEGGFGLEIDEKRNVKGNEYLFSSSYVSFCNLHDEINLMKLT